MNGRADRLRAWDEAYRVAPASLSIFRVLFGALLLVLLLPRHDWIATFPDAFFNPPPGITAAFSGFPRPAYFMAVNAVLIVAAIFLIGGRRVTLASVLISAGLLAGNMWAYSFGKIDHDVLLVILPLFLAAAGWDGRDPSRAQPMALLALVIAVAMVTAAWHKIRSGWLDPSASAVLGHSVALAAWDGGTTAWRLALRILPSAAWELMDYFTIAFEAAFLAVVARAAAFRALCAIACFFHVVVAMLMRITFLSNIPAYAAFVDWQALVANVRLAEPVERLQRWLRRRTEWQLLAASAILCVVYLSWGNPVRLAMGMLGPEHEEAPRMVATWVGAIVASVLAMLRLQRRT